MWAIFQLIRTSVLLLIAAMAVRIATWAARWLSGAAARREELKRWRLIGWAILLPISAALVSLQFGGFYGFTDSNGGDWSYFGHGWPLGHLYSFSELIPLRRQSDLAIYLTALAVDLLSLVVILAATRALLDRWLLLAHEKPRRWRLAAAQAAGWLAALAAVLLADRWLADPVIVPGTSILFYTPLAHDLWYCRAPVLFGLSCVLFAATGWLTKGVKTLARLRNEGVI